MKLWVGVLFVCVLLAFNCNAAETWYTELNQFACNTRGDLRELLKYLDQNDSEAFWKKIKTNRCFSIGGCMEVRVMQRIENENVVKIRMPGQTLEIWAPSYSITNRKPQCEQEWKKSRQE